MKTIGILALVALCSACFKGSAGDSLTVSKSVQLPAIPVSSVPNVGEVTLPPVSTTVDMSSGINDLSKIGTLNLSVGQNTLSDGDLSWVRHVSVSVAPTDGSLPAMTMADVDAPSGTTNTLDVSTTMGSSDLLSYFGEGQVSLTFTFTGDTNVPTNGPTLTWALQLNADISINKSVSDIGK
jgi:hypothetical protein